MSAKTGVVAGITAALAFAALLGLLGIEQKWQRNSELSEENRNNARIEADAAKISPIFQAQADMLLSEADVLFNSRTQAWRRFQQKDLLFRSKLEDLYTKATNRGEREVHSAFEGFEIGLMTCVSGAMNPNSSHSNSLTSCDENSPAKLRKDLADQARTQAFWQRQSE